MPVPVAYNDLSADADLRDHVGWVWYQTTVIVPERDMGQHILLRFGSVNYYAKVFFNSKEIGSHVGGHLPFEFDVTELVKFGAVNKITVAVNNTLSWSTIPQGDFNYAKDTTRLIFGRNISRTPEGAFKNVGNFDFFNYAGILRSVYLLKIPPSHIVDVWIIAEHLGSFSYEVTLSQNRSNEDVIVRMLDPDGVVVYSARGLEHKGSLTTVKPWWPRGMGEPNLYTLEADLLDVICVNRYYGWYIDMGKLDWINQSVYWDIAQWSDKYKRPILVTEYGADSLPGLNQVNSISI
ncbi:Beta-glucuronidase [Trichostrongylus colubriformis]|uniref:Beta-glucuronidase n=1 Tax=Trichostrongylus colubriformis TaxID=6319 RepID=A0AAN8FV76_TRICO